MALLRWQGKEEISDGIGMKLIHLEQVEMDLLCGMEEAWPLVLHTYLVAQHNNICGNWFWP